MSDAETVILSDDDEILEQRRVRQLPRVMDIRSVQFRRQGEQLQRGQQEQQHQQQQQQQQEHEQPNIMMVMQALMQMQQMNQQMQQTQQQTTQQILQILQLIQQQDNRFAAHDLRLEQLENGGGDRDAPVRYLRAVQPPEPAPADAGQRRNARYTPDEDLRIVQYLIERNKVDRAKSDSVWQEMRRDDEVIAKRTVSSLKQRFRAHIWPKVMAGQYTEDPQILHKFRRIWPERMFQAA